MLHEADLFGGAGGEGLGGTTVEHRVPRSVDADQAGDYDNCLLACRFCNRARSDRPLETGEVSLLDPTAATWSEHFSVDGPRLSPRSANAEYTAEVYDINDPRKIRRREARKKLIEDRLQLAELLNELPELLQLAEHQRSLDIKNFGRLILKIKELREQCLRALADLSRFAAIPEDAPEHCRCDSRRHHTVPDALDQQSMNLPILP